jgi:hypothetical protein
LALVPAVLVLMNVFYALSSYPAGVLYDDGSRTNVLAFGLLLLIAADLVMALTKESCFAIDSVRGEHELSPQCQNRSFSSYYM